MKNSDRFSSLSGWAKTFMSRTAIAIATVIASLAMANAQPAYDLAVIEGSTHGFSVENLSNNNFEWTVVDAGFNSYSNPDQIFDILEGQFDPEVSVLFKDTNREMEEMMYLVVTETRPNIGCSTKRALRIQVQPNNMFLEFAMKETQECFNIDLENYTADLNVGLNFITKKTNNVPIPESRFPLQVVYTVENKTSGGGVVTEVGPFEIAYNAENEYSLPIKEAVGRVAETTTYELVIKSVHDRLGAEIKQNNYGDPDKQDTRIQIRVINHLPHGGGMEMAIAWLGEE